MKGNFHVRFGERGGETRWLESQKVRSAPTLQIGLGKTAPPSLVLKGIRPIRLRFCDFYQTVASFFFRS